MVQMPCSRKNPALLCPVTSRPALPLIGWAAAASLSRVEGGGGERGGAGEETGAASGGVQHGHWFFRLLEWRRATYRTPQGWMRSGSGSSAGGSNTAR